MRKIDPKAIDKAGERTMTAKRRLIINPYVFVLTTLLLVTNCASRPEPKPSQAGNTVSGTVTINGKAENLKYAYARRMTKYLSPRREYFALVFTNKPAPEAELAKLLEDFYGNVLEQDFLKDKSISGVIFIVSKDYSEFNKRVRYEGQVIHDGRSYISSHWFDEFSMQKGRMRGKTYQEEEGGAEIKVAPDAGKPFTFKYAVEFEVMPQGEPKNQEWEGAVPPDLSHLLSQTGTAQGVVTVDGKTQNLKYAYALRQRKFFDEPEETIAILATDKPVAEEELMKVLRGLKTKEEIQGVVLLLATERDRRAGVSILHRSFDRGVLNFESPLENLSISKDRVAASLAGSDTEGTHKWNVSVSVDISFKR